MPRWEILVLNKVYHTDFFSQAILTNNPPNLNEICQAYLEFGKQNEQYGLIQENYLLSLANNAMISTDSRQVYEVIVQIGKQLGIQQYFNKESQQHSYLDIVMFSALSRCKIWPKIFKAYKGNTFQDKQFMDLKEDNELAKQKKKEIKTNLHLTSLLDWYSKFLKQFSQELEWKFDKVILSTKYQRMVEQRKANKKYHPSLFESLKNVDMQQIKQIINSEGIENLMNCVDKDTLKRITHFACESASLELVMYLDQFECVTWSELDSEEQTPIFYAVQGNTLEIVRFLVEEKLVNLDHQECQSRTAFYLACFLGYQPILEYLYHKGANINILSKLKRTPLTKACYLNHVMVVKWLLTKPGIQVQIQDVKGRTALHNAAWGPAGGKEGKKRADMILPDSPESVKMLLEYGHPVDLLDYEGNSALNSATSSNALDSMQILLASGADRERQNIYGETPFWLAAKYGHQLMVNALALTYKCSITTPDNKGMTPLLAAIIFEQNAVVNILVEWLLFRNPQINYKSAQPVKTELRHQEENNLICYSNADDRPPIFITQIIHVSKQYNKQKQSIYLLNLLIGHLKNNKIEETCFFNKVEQTQLTAIALQLLFLDRSIDYVEAFINFLSLTYEQNFPQGREEFHLQLINEFFKKGELKIIYTLLYESQKCEFLTQYLGKDLIEAKQIFKAIMIHYETLKDDQQLQDQYLIKLVLDLNINTLSVYQSNNILHILVKYRKIQPILILSQLRTENELIDFQFSQLLQQKDHSDFTPVELANILKYKDIQHVLSLSNNNLKNTLEQVSSPCVYQIFKYDSYIENVEVIPQVYQTIATNQCLYLLNYENSIKNLKECNKFYSKETYQKQHHTINNVLVVEKMSQIQGMIDELENSSLIGVDIEFYTEKPNLAVVCTIQLSTLNVTYIVDALSLRQWLEGSDCQLRIIFQDCQKIKVFHGCDNDLRWLACNFDFRVIGLFDTSHAQNFILDKKISYGLQQLCQEYLNINMDKSFQRADWRIRPLPQAMVNYAREDSEILLFIFIQQIPLIGDQRLKDLYQFSQDFSEKIYQKNKGHKIHITYDLNIKN